VHRLPAEGRGRAAGAVTGALRPGPRPWPSSSSSSSSLQPAASARPSREPGRRSSAATAWAGSSAPRPVCPVCGRFLEARGGPSVRAVPRGRPAFSFHRSCGAYAGRSRTSSSSSNTGNAPAQPASGPVRRDLARVRARLWEGADFLVPVPLHRVRRRDRASTSPAPRPRAG